MLKFNGHAETVQKILDVVKKTAYGVDFVLWGLENQAKIHYAMPLRHMVGDAFSYMKEYDGYRFNKIGHVYSPNSIIEAVINQKCRIDTGTFQNDMTSLQGRDDVLTLLVHLGYLAYDDDSGEVYIPNEEVR